MEKAVRLESLGLSDDKIAEHIGLSLSGLATMKTSPEYQATRTRMLVGVVGEYEEGLGEDLNYIRTKVRDHVPQALQVLIKSLDSPDEKFRLHAAESLLDRDGHMSKVSRIGLPAEDQGGSGSKIDSTIADGLIATLNAINATKVVVTPQVGEDSNGNQATTTATSEDTSISNEGASD